MIVAVAAPHRWRFDALDVRGPSAAGSDPVAGVVNVARVTA